MAKHAAAEEEGQKAVRNSQARGCEIHNVGRKKTLYAQAVLMQATDSVAVSPPERCSTQLSHCCRVMDRSRRSSKLAQSV